MLCFPSKQSFQCLSNDTINLRPRGSSSYWTTWTWKHKSYFLGSIWSKQVCHTEEHLSLSDVSKHPGTSFKNKKKILKVWMTTLKLLQMYHTNQLQRNYVPFPWKANSNWRETYVMVQGRKRKRLMSGSTRNVLSRKEVQKYREEGNKKRAQE